MCRLIFQGVIDVEEEIMENQLIDELTELIREKRFGRVRSLLEGMNPADIAELFEVVPEEELPILFRILPKELAAETFVEMDADEQELLIAAFSDRELSEVINELYVDDAVDLVEEMPALVVKRILKHASPEMRKSINELLNYPKDSAGSIMTTEYINLKRTMTVAQSFERIRKTGVDKETIYTCYVTDAYRRLIGILSVKELLLADSDAIIGDIMETNLISVHTLDDKEDVARMFDKYDFLAIPVVDAEDSLVGIVTVDDAIDVIQEENTEDIAKMAAIVPTEETYLKTPAWQHARNRIAWLLFLMLSASITGTIIQKYQDAFVAIPVLVASIPMLMGTGGNCSSQSSTMVIRGLALGEIKFRDFFKVLFKECRIAIMTGVVLAVVNAMRVFIMYHSNAEVIAQIPIFKLALVSGISLIGTVLLAKCMGCVLPMLAKKVKVDPAIMAAPLLTTILDTCSVLIFFNIATWILGI